MNECFKQAKWVVNDMLATSKIADENHNIFKYEYLDHKLIHRIDKNGSSIEEKITLSSVMHRGIVKSVKTDIVNLSKAKRKGLKVGALKFRSEVNSIPMTTGPWLCIRDNSHITIPGFANLKVYGLDQLKKFKEYEIADGRFIRKASGFYVHLSICIPKEEKI